MKRLQFGAAALFASLALGQEFNVGSKVQDFTLAGVDGNPVAYASLKGDTTVVVFTSTKCPISNAYNERMNAVYKDYSARGVRFVFVNANAGESAAEVAAHAKQNGFAFPVYKDTDNKVADRFGAQVTPETFVMDRAGVIRYHGYIDDSRAEDRIQNRGLRNALDAVLDGKPVVKAETKAFGCTIKRRAQRTT